MFSAAGILQTVGIFAKTPIITESRRLLTSDVLQGDCDTSGHFSGSAKGPVTQLFISSNSCKRITNNNTQSVFAEMALGEHNKTLKIK